MKRVKSFAKIIIALLMALALTTLTACDVLDDFFGKGGENGGTGDGNVYQVTLENNGGTFTDSFTEYTSGTAKNLPASGTKEHYTFGGWYENGDFSGNSVSKIPTGATGDKTYYAKWTPETYNLTFCIKDNNSYSSPVTSYTYGTACALPTPEKDDNSFNGWYVGSDLSGSKVTEIAVGEYGNKTFYGEWVSQQVQPMKYSVTLNVNGGELKSNLTEYTEGVGATLPTPTKSGFTFGGWYDNSNCTGSEVTSIPANATGAKQFWAKWIAQTSDTLTVTAFGGYEEGAYVEFNMVSGVSSYSVAYKTKNGTDAFKTIDSELVRVDSSSGTVRADVVGISAGDYTLQITAGGTTAIKDVTVTSYDRSGYAHFNYTSGVGAYKDDGTPKSNAEIIYVTESTKNTVTASYLTGSGDDKKGIVAILSNVAKSSKPVIIRIIGRISAATWNAISYDGVDATNPANIKGKNGQQLPTSSSSLTQAALISGGYNTLNTATYSVLNNLSSKATYGSSKYDSCWNDCSIGGSSSKPKNVTVEGIGTDAEIFQWGMTWKYATSIEVRNITFTDYTEDACSFEGGTSATDVDKFDSQRLWVHNCTFNRGKNYWDVTDEQDKADGDGATDFKRASYITIAYNNYYNNHKTGLIGSDDNVTTANVTFHHNFYEICESRLPLARQANMHMYNNYYYGSTNTNMSIRSGAYAFIEACYFDNANNPIVTQLGKADKVLTGYGRLDGYVKAFNCVFVGKQVDTSNYNVTITSDRTATVQNDNIFDDQFDLDSTKFYLNSNGTTKATLLTNASQARFDCVNLSGAHKSPDYIKITTDAQLKSYHDSRAVKS